MAEATNVPPLHLISLRIRNFLRVEALDIDADGNSVILRGPNAAGKTSTIDAIFAALVGRRASGIEQPIHAGAREATVTVDLGQFIVTRKWVPNRGPSLLVKAKNGRRVSSPQALLDGLLSSHSIDPLAWIEQTPRDQVRSLLRAFGVRPPVETVAAILELPDVPAVDEDTDAAEYIDSLVGDNGSVYLERRDCNVLLRRSTDALAAGRERLDAAKAAMPGGEQLDPAEIRTRMEAAQAQGKARSEATGAMNLADERLRRANEDLAGSIASQQAAEATVQRLEAELAEAKQNVVLADQVVIQRRGDLSAKHEELDAARAAVEAAPDPSEAIAACREELVVAEKQTEARQELKALERQVADQERIVADNEKQYALLDDQVSQIRALGDTLLDGVDLGDLPLTVHGGLLYANDVPLSQASGAEQLRIACAVATCQDPLLKLLRIDDGEKLDKHGREALLEFARERGFQVVMTAVSDDDGLSVEIVENDGAESTG